MTRTSVNELFEWKNGGPLSGRKKRSVESNYLFRLNELAQLDESISPEEFLARFERGGAIWRIFWLHIWLPNRFPIYDQHVHRAMEWIETGRPGEIPKADSAKIDFYVSRFIPFFELFEGVERRRVDKALWACGKCMKTLRAAPIT